MVIPCSRSARRPSVSSARSISPASLFLLCFSSAASWSVRMLLLSYSNRPMRVLFPSSTLPAVMNRSKSILKLKVTVLFSVFHGGFGHLVVYARLAAFAGACSRYFTDDIFDGRSRRLHRRSACHVPDGTIPDLFSLDTVAGIEPYEG